MIIYPFPLMAVISQIKAYIFSASMENRAVRLGCLSKTQSNALNQKHPQNNQLKALHLLLGRNKLPQMKNTYKLKPVWKILSTDGLLSFHHVLLGSWSYCYFSVPGPRKKKQVKMTSQELNFSTQKYRVTMPVHEFKFNDDLNLCFYNSFEVSTESYATRPSNESKGNATTNSKRKKMCTISNKWVCKCSSDMLPKCICPCAAAVKIRTVKSCICLTPHILSFLTVKELSDTVFPLYNKVSKEGLRLVLVETYIFPITKNLLNQAVKFTLHLVIVFNICHCCIYMYFFNKEKEHKFHPWLLFYLS